jgi:hypothetical protein
VETILRLVPGVDLRYCDHDGNNSLHLAAMHPCEKVMRLLTNHVAAHSSGSRLSNATLNIQERRAIYYAANHEVSVCNRYSRSFNDIMAA